MATVNPNPGVHTMTPPAPVPKTPALSQQPFESGRVKSTDKPEKSGPAQSAKPEGSSQAATSEPSRAEVREIAESLGQVVSIVNQGISIRIDESTDMLVTEIVNRETNEVVKQIPPEELIQLAGRLREFLGILLDIEV